MCGAEGTGGGYETCQVRKQYASIRKSLRNHKSNEVLLHKAKLEF